MNKAEKTRTKLAIINVLLIISALSLAVLALDQMAYDTGITAAKKISIDEASSIKPALLVFSIFILSVKSIWLELKLA